MGGGGGGSFSAGISIHSSSSNISDNMIIKSLLPTTNKLDDLFVNLNRIVFLCVCE